MPDVRAAGRLAFIVKLSEPRREASRERFTLATESKEVDEIRSQMAKIRSDLHQEMREVVAGAAAVADWRAYIRKRPWIAIGAAFASGYLLVPRRSRTVVAPAPAAPVEYLAPMARPRSEAPAPRRFRTIGWILSLVGPILTRVAQSYALNAVENMLINNPPDRPGPGARSEPPTSHRASPGGPDYSRRF